MDSDKTPEQNLDEDILQCRAEILQALGQDSGDTKAESLSKADHTAEQSDTAVAEDEPELIIDTPDPDQSEDTIEKWLLTEENSASDSFDAFNVSHDQHHEEEEKEEEKAAAAAAAAEEEEEEATIEALKGTTERT